MGLAATLKSYLTGRPLGVPVWPGTWSTRAADMIQADALAAGVPVEVVTRDGLETLDFHSLRGCYATMLDGLDITLKDRQELMRHSDPRLTLNRYTRARLHDLGRAVEKLPEFLPPPPADDRAAG
jgi:integrase